MAQQVIPGKAEFSADVETESYYVILEVPPGDQQSIASKAPPPDAERVQILDLHSANPIISCRGEIYSCNWADTVGTAMYFVPPKGLEEGDEAAAAAAAGATATAQEAGAGHNGTASAEAAAGDDEVMADENQGFEGVTAAQILAAAKLAAEADEDSEAKLLGIGTMRLEGRVVNVTMAGEAHDKKKAASEGIDFQTRLDAAIKRREIREKLMQQTPPMRAGM